MRKNIFILIFFVLESVSSCGDRENDSIDTVIQIESITQEPVYFGDTIIVTGQNFGVIPSQLFLAIPLV